MLNMGSTVSAIHTPLGQSLIGKTYITKIPVSFSYSLHDKVYVIQEWRDRPSLCNPLIGEFRIKLKTGLIFTIIDIKRRCNFETGISLVINIKIENDMTLNNKTKFIKSIEDPPFLRFGTWALIPYQQSKNLLFQKGRDGVEDIIKTKGITGKIYAFEFFEKDGNVPDFDKSHQHKISHLELY